MFRGEQFLLDYGLPVIRSGHKRARYGWIQTSCPFCGRADAHLGVHLESGVWHCWSCGGHTRQEVIKRFTKCENRDVKTILEKYSSLSVVDSWKRRKDGAFEVELPECRKWLPNPHWDYLFDRGFDPDYIVDTWRIEGTGFAGEYADRIIIPIYWKGQLVSFTSRDITGEHPAKYKSCPAELEVINHKHILYGADLVFNDTVVVVEGPLDAWKLGPGAVALFGTAFTQPQVLELSMYNKAIILFDTEDEAQAQADKLAYNLSALGLETEIATLPSGDPGSLTLEEAAEVMRALLAA